MTKKTYITVNRNVINSNRKHGEREPAIAVRRGKSGSALYTNEVTLAGPSRIVYGEEPLPCGARIWIETEGEVTFMDGK